jgi:hypothetical protein
MKRKSKAGQVSQVLSTLASYRPGDRIRVRFPGEARARIAVFERFSDREFDQPGSVCFTTRRTKDRVVVHDHWVFPPECVLGPARPTRGSP